MRKQITRESGLGIRQRAALEFIRGVNGWHTFASDVRPVIVSLVRRGLVEIYEPGKQFRLAADL